MSYKGYKLLSLMVEDFVELLRTDGVEYYNVHPMDNMEDYRMDKREKNVTVYLSSEFNVDDSWFINIDNVLESLSEDEFRAQILKDKDKILKSYYKAEEIHHDLKNNNEVRTAILEINIFELDELDEDYEIIYQDVNLEAIAEILAEVKVVDLYDNFANYAGTMEINQVDRMFYLTNKN